MNWEHEAKIFCNSINLEVVGFDGGWVFVKDDSGMSFPVSEEKIATMMRESEESGDE